MRALPTCPSLPGSGGSTRQSTTSSRSTRAPVDRLSKSGRLSGAEVSAAGRWVRDHEWQIRSAYVDPSTAWIRAGGANRSPEERLHRGVAAAVRRDQVRVALGDEAMSWLVDHVHLSRPLSSRLAAGQRGGNQIRPVVDRFAAILEALAEHYAEVDRGSASGIVRPQRPESGHEMEMAA